jgi:site-specific DNA-cytosine methylase
MRTSYTYFSGGCLADTGLAAAGYVSQGGLEYDNAIADVARMNGHTITTADVRTVDLALLLSEAPDWFHASPSCKKASQANSDGGETDEDRDCGKAVARFIAHWQPATVSIENVWGYRTFDAFKTILEALKANGYSFDYWHLNAADYGVPQTRKRLILLARKGTYRIQRPSATHQEGGDLFAEPWVGWYEAIEDLIPTLPASKFAEWQLARLPEGLRGSLLFGNNDPEWGDPYKWDAAPAMSITTQTGSRARAFILDCQNAGDPTHERGVTVPHGDTPMYTLSASMGKRPARAFIIGGGNTNKTVVDSKARYEDQPMFTVAAADSAAKQARAFLVDGTNAGRDITLRVDEKPCYTLGAQNKGSHRAWLQSGRVVSMTPRALARFQSVPDSYILPDRSSLACTVIGNGVPCLLMQRLAESVN